MRPFWVIPVFQFSDCFCFPSDTKFLFVSCDNWTTTLAGKQFGRLCARIVDSILLFFKSFIFDNVLIEIADKMFFFCGISFCLLFNRMSSAKIIVALLTKRSMNSFVNLSHLVSVISIFLIGVFTSFSLICIMKSCSLFSPNRAFMATFPVITSGCVSFCFHFFLLSFVAFSSYLVYVHVQVTAFGWSSIFGFVHCWNYMTGCHASVNHCHASVNH